MIFLRNIKVFFLLIYVLGFLSSICSAASDLFMFNGEISLLEKQIGNFFIFSDTSSLGMKINKVSEDEYNFNFSIKHWITPFFDLSSEIQSLVNLNAKDENRNKYIHGQLFSNYSLVDYKPISELSGVFSIQNDKIHLESLSFGQILCNGQIDLFYPYNVDLVVTLSPIKMKSFLSLWMKGADSDSSGFVSGEIKVLGSLPKLYLAGNLASHDGHIEKLKYNTFLLKIKGIYPQMEIFDSSVSQREGMSFSFKGAINLGDSKNFRKQIKKLTISPVIAESNLKKEWTIRSLEQKDSGKTEIKYFLRKKKEGSSSPEASGVLGLERSIEF